MNRLDLTTYVFLICMLIMLIAFLIKPNDDTYAICAAIFATGYLLSLKEDVKDHDQ